MSASDGWVMLGPVRLPLLLRRGRSLCPLPAPIEVPSATAIWWHVDTNCFRLGVCCHITHPSAPLRDMTGLGQGGHACGKGAFWRARGRSLWAGAKGLASSAAERPKVAGCAMAGTGCSTSARADGRPRRLPERVDAAMSCAPARCVPLQAGGARDRPIWSLTSNEHARKGGC
jgi:hypothetical protein